MAQLTFSGGINQREHGDLANMVGISVMLKQKRQTKIFLHFSFSWSVGWLVQHAWKAIWEDK